MDNYIYTVHEFFMYSVLSWLELSSLSHIRCMNFDDDFSCVNDKIQIISTQIISLCLKYFWTHVRLTTTWKNWFLYMIKSIRTDCYYYYYYVKNWSASRFPWVCKGKHMIKCIRRNMFWSLFFVSMLRCNFGFCAIIFRSNAERNL